LKNEKAPKMHFVITIINVESNQGRVFEVATKPATAGSALARAFSLVTEEMVPKITKKASA
jgi:hypothetical protein